MADAPIRILLAEDNPGDARLLHEMLRDQTSLRFDLCCADRLDGALDCLRVRPFDVLLLDLSLPDSNGLDTVSRACQAAPFVPIIVLTGTDDETVGLEAVRRGAQDYLVKGQTDGRLLVRAIRYAAQRKAAEEALSRSRQQIQAANQTLEQRVAERTAEAHQRARQLQQLAAELTQAEQRERQRLAGVLHDHLQQLLVGAKFHVGILRSQVPAGEADQTLAQMDDLLDQSLAASRSLTAELSPPILSQGNLAQVLTWLGRWVRDKHGLKVDVQVDEKIDPPAREVRVLLFQAVRELLLNITKHARVERARVRLSGGQAGQVQVTVEDQGVGFHPARPRASVHRSSGGFGLFSIRERLEWMGGRMEILSRPGEGTCVTLLAPCSLNVQGPAPGVAVTGGIGPAAPTAGAAAAPGPTTAGGTSVIHVLLADDHPVMRDGLCRMLQMQEGIRVVGQAADGQEAVALARQLRPDVVLMDVSMPHLSGIEATRQITRDLPGVKVIGLSMHAQDDVAASMAAAGATAYLTKTIPPGMLIATVRAHGGAPSGRAAECAAGSAPETTA